MVPKFGGFNCIPKPSIYRSWSLDHSLNQSVRDSELCALLCLSDITMSLEITTTLWFHSYCFLYFTCIPTWYQISSVLDQWFCKKWNEFEWSQWILWSYLRSLFENMLLYYYCFVYCLCNTHTHTHILIWALEEKIIVVVLYTAQIT
jgi:hypothetical protein